MKKNVIVLLSFGLLFISQVYAQDENKQKPSVQDLDFLIGTWDLDFKFYDTHKPEIGVWFTEKGAMVCEYGMLKDGVPKYIICSGQLKCDSGRFKDRQREFKTFIRYGNFVNGFERIGLYSNWPGTAKELLFYRSEKRIIEIKGELTVVEGIERYEDIYYFNEDYTSYTRINKANFPDMPVTQFNITHESTAKKRSN